jgi:Leucine-rich repeat (LRR) protein
MYSTRRFTVTGFVLSVLAAWSIPSSNVRSAPFQAAGKTKGGSAPVAAPPAAPPRSAVTLGFAGKVGPKDEGFVPGFESYKLRFGPGEWAGAKINITSAWGDKNPDTDLWDWSGGLNVRYTETLSDKDGYYIIYSLASAKATNWVVVNFRFTLRDGRHGIANALIPYQGDPKIPKETVEVLGNGGKLGPKDQGYVPEFESYKLRFGPGEWAGTKVLVSSNWGEGSGAKDLWGWKDGAEARSSEVRLDRQGHYFIHSVRTAGHSRWVASLFRFSRKDGRSGVAQALYSYSGALTPPTPTGQPTDYPVAADSTARKRPRPTLRMLAAAQPTNADLIYLRSISDEFKGMELEDLAEMTKLDLKGKAIDDEGMVHLRGLKQLQALSLRETRVSDAGLDNIAGLTGLVRLDLIGTPTTDAGLEVVARLTGLTELFFDSTLVTDSGLRSLRSLRRLESLSLSTTDVGDAGLEALRGLTEIRYLNLGKDPGFESEKITEAGLVLLKGFRKLEKLALTGFNLGNGGLAQLRGVPRLTWLNLTGAKFADADLVHLQWLPELVEIHLEQTPVTGAGLVYLKSLPKLKYLFLGFSDIGDAGLAHLAGLRNLQVLSITKGNVSDAGLVHLRGLTQLDRLYLSDNKITGAGVANLRAMTKLQRLVLYYNKLDNATLAMLKTLPDLKQLIISGDQITDAGLFHIKEMPNLNYLSISWTKVTQAGIDDLKRSLPQLRIDYGNF